jgi:hypothetical protein
MRVLLPQELEVQQLTRCQVALSGSDARGRLVHQEATGVLGNSPLHWAAAGGHVDVTRCLLSHGASLVSLQLRFCTQLELVHEA